MTAVVSNNRIMMNLLVRINSLARATLSARHHADLPSIIEGGNPTVSTAFDGFTPVLSGPVVVD